MRFLRVSIFGGALAAFLIFPAPLSAAFIDPADQTGTFGTDPSDWAFNLPASINTNTTATTRSLAPWTRGSANTTYQGWDRFTSKSLPNNPNNASLLNEVDANPNNLYGTATLTQLVTPVAPIIPPGILLTSGGNIYSPVYATQFSLAVPNANLGAGYQTNFLIQVRASTGLFDLSSFQVNGLPLSGLLNFSQQLLNTATYDSGQGGDASAIDYKFEFSLPGNSALDTITFGSDGPGLSFDKLSVDTSISAVPEPSSLAMVGLFAVSGLMAIRRHRNRN